jgi:hypothetical protein
MRGMPRRSEYLTRCPAESKVMETCAAAPMRAG